MRPVRRRRLLALLGLVVAASLALGLVLYALRQNINLFFTPSQIVAGVVPLNQRLRVGGLVVPGSVERAPDSLAVVFLVTDTAATVPVTFEGILPDLFRPGQGVVAVGRLDAQGTVRAEQVLARHDENYQPPEVQRAIEQARPPDADEY
ncbi:MAG: cytochrome c maturation protein CcmE [Cellvibrionales bacterium]|nr:cytochrome c maturation protein CcmE [Cellvibrionales bacterium]